MTVQESMRALAEALEPKVENKPSRWNLESPFGFWTSVRPGNPPVYCTYWFHVDFLHSEDASARLLEAMPPLLMAKCRLRSPGEAIQWDVQVGGNHELSDDRKTAVFLAALAWKGIERPEGL
jgi:hypothetical protein